MPDPRRRGGGRVLRGRPPVAAGDARRRGHLHRPGGRQALLPLGARPDLRRARHRLRRRPPGLRVPVGGRRVRRRRPCPRPHVHRPARQRPRALRVEGGDAAAARGPGPADDPGLGPARRRGPRPRGGRADRLSGARQAVGRRRRQGHADGPLAARAGRGPADLPLRGARRVRRRRAVPRALARGQPARRGAGRGRPVRPRRPPLGARLLGPAPAPEDPRGVAVAGDDRGGTTGARRARDQGRGRGGLRERRHARVPRRQRRQRLLHRDQLPDPGRAPGDRDADRHRPRRDADADRGGRAAGVHAGGRRPARPRDRVPDQRRGPRAGLPPGRRHDRAVQRPRRSRRAVRLARLLGLRGAAVLRLAARQARGLGARPARAPSRAAAPRSTSWSSTASSPTRRSTARCWCRSRSSTAGSRPTCSTASAAPRSSPGRCARERLARRPPDPPDVPSRLARACSPATMGVVDGPAARDTLSDPAWSSM